MWEAFDECRASVSACELKFWKRQLLQQMMIKSEEKCATLESIRVEVEQRLALVEAQFEKASCEQGEVKFSHFFQIFHGLRCAVF